MRSGSLCYEYFTLGNSVATLLHSATVYSSNVPSVIVICKTRASKRVKN